MSGRGNADCCGLNKDSWAWRTALVMPACPSRGLYKPGAIAVSHFMGALPHPLSPDSPSPSGVRLVLGGAQSEAAELWERHSWRRGVGIGTRKDESSLLPPLLVWASVRRDAGPVRLGQTGTRTEESGRGSVFQGWVWGRQLPQAARTSLLPLHRSTPAW